MVAANSPAKVASQAEMDLRSVRAIQTWDRWGGKSVTWDAPDPFPRSRSALVVGYMGMVCRHREERGTVWYNSDTKEREREENTPFIPLLTYFSPCLPF